MSLIAQELIDRQNECVELRQLRKEVAAFRSLAAQVDKEVALLREVEGHLPKTADGVPVYPGMKAFVLPVAGPNRMVPTECVVDMITGDALNGQPEKIHVWIATDENYGGYTPEHLLFSTRENAALKALEAAREKA